MVKKYLKHIIKYFSLLINLQNGRQQILYLLEIADFSHGIEFIFNPVIAEHGFNGSVNIPESCDFRSQFLLINIIGHNERIS